jgi:hypothetical protein
VKTATSGTTAVTSSARGDSQCGGNTSSSQRVILFGIYGFLTLTSFETRVLSRRTTRRAADLYPQYADSVRKQRQYAKEHGGEWTSDDGGRSREPEDAQPHEHGRAAPCGPASGSA